MFYISRSHCEGHLLLLFFLAFEHVLRLQDINVLDLILNVYVFFGNTSRAWQMFTCLIGDFSFIVKCRPDITSWLRNVTSFLFKRSFFCMKQLLGHSSRNLWFWQDIARFCWKNEEVYIFCKHKINIAKVWHALWNASGCLSAKYTYRLLKQKLIRLSILANVCLNKILLSYTYVQHLHLSNKAYIKQCLYISNHITCLWWAELDTLRLTWFDMHKLIFYT